MRIPVKERERNIANLKRLSEDPAAQDRYLDLVKREKEAIETLCEIYEMPVMAIHKAIADYSELPAFKRARRQEQRKARHGRV